MSVFDELFVPMEDWGKDHWSTLLYVETRVVDHNGKLDERQLRARSEKYPTRLKGGVELPMHGDEDCIQDMIADGLMEWSDDDDESIGLTDRGWMVAHAVRKHVGITRRSADFDPTPYLSDED